MKLSMARTMVTAVVLGLLYAGTGCSAQGDPHSVSSPEVAAPKTLPAMDVWPGSFVRVPAQLKGVGKVIPLVSINSREILMATKELHPILIAYNHETMRHRTLARVPGGARYHHIQKVLLHNSNFYWIARNGYDGHPQSELWSMPAAGGMITKLARLPEAVDFRDGHISVSGDSVILWRERQAFLVPTDDGTVKEISVDEGYRISEWPWAYDGGGTILNVVTGEKLTAGGDPDGRLQCAQTWCVGRPASQLAGTSQAVVRHVDGSGSVRVPAAYIGYGLEARRFGFFALVEHGGSSGDAISGGNRPGTLGRTIVIYDHCTRKHGILRASEGLRADESADADIRIGGSVSNNAPMLFSRTGDASAEYALLDLARIPCE